MRLYSVLGFLLVQNGSGCFLTSDGCDEAGDYAGCVTGYVDVSYGTHGMLLDVWVPSSSGSFPALIHAHEGGYTGGSKESLTHGFATKMASRGVVGFVFNYRLTQKDANGTLFLSDGDHLAGRTLFPVLEAAEDLKQAFDFAHASYQYKVDNSRIGLAGMSAGASTSLYAAYSPIAREQNPQSWIRNNISIVIAISGSMEAKPDHPPWSPVAHYGDVGSAADRSAPVVSVWGTVDPIFSPPAGDNIITNGARQYGSFIATANSLSMEIVGGAHMPIFEYHYGGPWENVGSLYTGPNDTGVYMSTLMAFVAQQMKMGGCRRMSEQDLFV